MNPQFRSLTRHEMFFGFTPNTNLSNGGVVNKTELISKVAPTPMNVPYVSPTPNIPVNTGLIAQQQAAWSFSDFIWKYRLEIGIGSIIVAGAIWYIYSVDQKEKKKRINQADFSNQY